jgi:hypothetical protein
MFQLSGILEFASEPSLLGRLYSLTGNGFRRIFNVHAFFLFKAILWFLLSLLSSSPWASIPESFWLWLCRVFFFSGRLLAS